MLLEKLQRHVAQGRADLGAERARRAGRLHKNECNALATPHPPPPKGVTQWPARPAMRLLHILHTHSRRLTRGREMRRVKITLVSTHGWSS